YYGFGRNLGCRLQLKYPIGFSRPIDFSARDVPPRSAGVAQSLSLGEIGFSSPQFLLSALPLVNVRKQVVPTHDPAFVVTETKAPGVKPAVDTISPAEPVINVIRVTGFDRIPPGGGCARKIIWVDSIAGSPT